MSADITAVLTTGLQITATMIATGPQGPQGEPGESLDYTPENIANKGQNSGYAGLDATGKVPLAQLPVLAGGGDMVKATYDTNDSGVVDDAEKVNGLTVATAVPAGAIFTDTVYTHPSYTAQPNGLFKVTIDALGHISTTIAVAKSDITGLGIPAQDTTYSDATTTASGLMSSSDKTKMDAITGTNTGDETGTTIKTKLGISTLSGSNTGDQTLSSLGLTASATELNYTDGVTSAIQTQLNILGYDKFSSYATNIDANDIYVNIEWKRPDATTYCKSTLSGGTSPKYTQIQVDYYDAAGTTIINTITWNLSYDANDFLYQKVVA